MLLVEFACFEVNSIPYGKDSQDLYVCPNDILIPMFEMDSLERNSSPLHNVNVLIEKLKLYHSQIQLVLEQTFQKDWKHYAPGHLREQKIKNLDTAK